MIGPLVTALASLLALAPAAPPGAPKTVTRVDQTWVCRGNVDLASVKVTMTPKSVGLRRNEDAVHLARGCTGRIGRIDVVQYAGDGIKVQDGVHDLTIGGGSVRCFAKAPDLHQDGVQVMGGQRITLRGLHIDCGRADDRLINSNLFINKAGKAVSPPTDVVCDGCTFGGWAAHTVSVQDSVRSGVTGSALCIARFPQLTLTIGPEAVDPVGSDNTVRQCGPGRLTLEVDRDTITYPKRSVLGGLFLGQALGSPVTLEARPYDGTAFRPVATVHTNKVARWLASVRPGVETTYRARLGAVMSPAVTVHVRPHVVLRQDQTRFVARVYASRSFRGLPVRVQQRGTGGWVDIDRIQLGTGSEKAFAARSVPRGARLRLILPAAPGYLTAMSKPVVVK